MVYRKSWARHDPANFQTNTATTGERIASSATELLENVAFSAPLRLCVARLNLWQ